MIKSLARLNEMKKITASRQLQTAAEDRVSLKLFSKLTGVPITKGVGAIFSDLIQFPSANSALLAVRKASIGGFRLATPEEVDLLRSKGFAPARNDLFVVSEQPNRKSYGILQDTRWHAGGQYQDYGIKPESWTLGSFVSLN